APVRPLRGGPVGVAAHRRRAVRRADPCPWRAAHLELGAVVSRLVDADVLTARLQERADYHGALLAELPRGKRSPDIAIGTTEAIEDAIRIVKSAPIHLDVSHGVERHNGGVGVAVSESDCREASAGSPTPVERSDTAESPAAAPPPGALEGVGAPASPDP